MDIKNFSDTFEQNNYENTIKTNFASSLREKLIIKLLEKQWLLNPMIQEK